MSDDEDDELFVRDVIEVIVIIKLMLVVDCDIVQILIEVVKNIEVDEVVDIDIVEKDHDVMRQCVDDDENDDEHNLLILIQGDVDDEVY